MKRPASYWAKSVHAYVDNKNFVMPPTPKQRAKFRQTMITGHLRKASEDTQRGLKKPRRQRAFLGVPSVCVAAAVAKDRVILWRVHDRPWNGQAAADTYACPMLKALKRTWGDRKVFTIVEGGDRKGNQSKKGIDAKARVGIKALTPPPRSPSLMPLDLSIWKEIQNKVNDTAPKNTESKDDFLARLRKCAQKLPKGYVQRVINRTKSNIQGIGDA